MSITSEINRIKGNISDAYDAVSTKGGTLPATQNSANLPAAILTINGGSGGDTEIVSAKNSSGDIVPANDKVFLEDLPVWSRDFNTGVPEQYINDVHKTLILSSSSSLIYTPNNSFDRTWNSSCEFIFGYDLSNADISNTYNEIEGSSFWFFNPNYPGNKYSVNPCFKITSSLTTYRIGWSANSEIYGQDDQQYVSSDSPFYSISIQDHPIIYFKTHIDNSGAVFYASFDGISFTQYAFLSYPKDWTKILNLYWSFNNIEDSGIKVLLGDCCLKLDGVEFWKPYFISSLQKTIVPFSEVTQAAITGRTQESIAVNATGNVKILKAN